MWDGAVGKMVWLGRYASKAEADRVSQEAKDSGRAGPLTRLAVFERARWRLLPGRDPHTQANYQQALGPILKAYGQRDVRRVTPMDIARWTNEYASYQMEAVSSLFADAVRLGLRTDNPCDQLRLRRRPSAGDPPSPLEVEKLIGATTAACVDERNAALMRAVIALAAYCGLRKSECLGLAWGDIDWIAERIYVARQRRRGQVKPVKLAHRSRHPRKYVYMPPPVVQALKAWHQICSEPASGWVMRWWIAGDRGLSTNISEPKFQQTWALVRQHAGVSCRFHDLRHFCATNLVERGATPTEVAAQMRHGDKGQTAWRIYVHPDTERALERVQGIWESESDGEKESGSA